MQSAMSSFQTMEPTKEAINVRLCYLNRQLCGSGISNGNSSAKRWITKETLLDALTVLYDECNNESIKKSDEFVAKFIEKYRPMVSELKQLRVNISDFEVKHLIGRGHFGEVNVVKEKFTGDIYAMKTLKKDITLKHRDIAFFEEERDIMALSKSNWLVKLQYSFQDSSQLYLIMEYCPGGDLAGLLERRGRPLSEKDAIFYIAEIIEGLKELHTLGFVHRDLKPDNVLLDRCGHLKLADFGSATRLSSLGNAKGSMPIGTTEYIAPEILMAIEKPKKFTHGTPCDYWSLGIIAYELVTCKTPFSSSSKTVVYTYKRIVEHGSNTDLVHLKYPADLLNISHDYKMLIENLLHPNPSKRPNHENISTYKIFDNTPWYLLRNQAPPFVPIVNGKDDVSNFLELEKQKPSISVENFRSKSQFNGRNLPFIGFTYSQDINLSPFVESYEDVKKISDTTSSSGHSSGSNGIFNTSLNGTAICLSNARETEKLLESRKREIDALHKELAMIVSKLKLLEEKEQKMIAVENHRSELEKDLAEMACKNQKLQHQLESEHKERKVLETKSLQLIRCAKKKWKEKTEEQVAALNKKINEIELQQSESNDTIRSLEYRLQSKSDSLEQSLNELNVLRKFKETHKDVEKARIRSRQSVAELDRISQESNIQIKTLTQKFNNEIKLRTNLESELKDLLEEKRLAVDRENDVLETLRHDKDIHTREIVLWTEKYNQKCEEVSNLQETISMMENHIFEIQCSKEKAIEKENTLRSSLSKTKRQSECDSIKFENQIKKLTTEISELKMENKEKNSKIMTINREKNEIQTAFDKASACEEKHKERVSVLEELVSKLQLEVTALENFRLEGKTSTPKGKNDSSLHLSVENIANAERICVLQEQITKLEDQLKSSREECILLKQESRKANSALWKKEKEFSDCDLDRRFAERELKEAKTQISTLQNTIKQSGTDHEKAITDLQKLNDNQAKELQAVQKTVESLNSTITGLENKVKILRNSAERETKENTNLQQKLNLEIQGLNNKIEILEADSKSAKEKQSKAELIAEKCTKENKVSENDKHSEREQRIRLEVTLQQKIKECDSLQTNYKILQNACTVLEEQLIDFEKVIDMQDTQNNEMKNEIVSLKSDAEKWQVENSKIQKLLDVQNFNVVSSELKLKEITEKLLKERTKNTDLEKQINIVFQQEAMVSSEVTNKGVEIAQLQSELKIAKMELNSKRSEITSLKEECTLLLTDVANLREDNMRIQLELKEYKENYLISQALLKDREEELSARQYHWQQCEMKAEATIAQQIKLIDFLQTKVEEVSKRKKTFSDMLFGKTNKEIIILPTTPQTPINNRFSRDESQSALSREKFKNRDLENRVSTLQDKLKVVETTPVCAVDTEKKYVGDILIDGWLRIQKGSLLVKVYMKLIDNCIRWQEDKDNSKGEISLLSEHVEIKDNLDNRDINILLSETEKKNAFKVNVFMEDCQQNKSLLIVCISSQQKENWIAHLKKFVKVVIPKNNNNPSNFNLKPFLSINTSDKLHFSIELKKDLYLIGGEKCLYCFGNDEKKTTKVVPGINGMRKVKVIPTIDQILFLDTNGKLMHTSLRQFISFLKSIKNHVNCEPPKFNLFDCSEIPSPKETFNIFDVSNCQNDTERVLVCASTSSNLIIFEYENLKMTFKPLRCLKTEPISCMKFTQHTVIVGSHKFYEIDLKTFNVEEFLDPSDVSLSHAVYAYKKNIHPLEIIQTKTACDKMIEYLLCYNGFGVFVDEYGQKSRPDDIKWTNHPSNIVYRKPFIFITYYSSVEIVHLKEDSFQRTWSDRDSVCSSSSSNSYNLPKKITVEFNSPYYLGKSLTPSSIFISQKNKFENSLEIFEFNGTEICKSNLASSVDTLDTIDDIDSCKNLANDLEVSLSALTDSDSNGAESSIVEARTDFSSKIREKAKVINSLKRENDKVNAIRGMISKTKNTGNSSGDSSDDENESSYEEKNMRKYSNQSNSLKYKLDNNLKNILKEKNSTETTPVLRKQVRFNKSPI